MRWLKRLLFFIVALVALLVVVAFFLPRTSHVERSITIDRPPSEVFGVLDNLHRFNAWSPWFDLDPNAQYTFSGPPSGVGTKVDWSGNKAIGSGSQEIVESRPSEWIKTQLSFGDNGKPTATLRLQPVAQGTTVTWSLDQSFEDNLIGRYFGLAMDSMIGADYEKGLGKLKTLVESFPVADISGVHGEILDLAAQPIYFVSAGPVVGSAAAKESLTIAYAKIGAFLVANKVAMQGPPMTITTSNDPNAGWAFDAAIAVAANQSPPSGEVKAGSTYAGKAVRFIHVGSYDKLPDTLVKARAWLAVQGFKPTDRVIQEYLSDPGDTPVEQLQTRITIPVGL